MIMSNLVDYSLQLGAFALEADFLDAKQFSAALSAWAETPSKPLTEVMLSQNLIQADDLSLLQALWLQQRKEEGTTRFQSLKVIGTGGLGTVSEVRDLQLDRSVALKEMRPHLFRDPISLHRFLNEAEITGSLEHPSIVPVYSAGLHPNGVPYYAMRLLRGKNLKQVVEEYHLETSDHLRFEGIAFRRLLGNLMDVCKAIDFAHRKGIVHRDLKPANIVVGEQGETMVVDWGLARRLSSPTEDASLAATPQDQSGSIAGVTSPGSLIGTIAYMSPEQAKAENQQIGIPSDVFNLGATLYFMLTGKAPYRGKEIDEILVKAKACDFATPRSLNHAIPKPLTAICLKAMSKNPEDRYASAAALYSDLECWMALESISVLGESFSERIARTMRKHRALTQVLLGCGAVLLLAISLFSWSLMKQINITNNAKRKIEKLYEEKTALANQEEATRVLADQQGKLALDTLRSVVLRIQRSLSKINAAQEVRKGLLETSLQGLDKVAASLENRVDVNRTTMLANKDLGMIYLLVGDRDGQNATTRSLKHLNVASRIARQIVEANSSTDGLRDLSIAEESCGDVHLERGEFELAMSAYQRALEASQKMATLSPHDPLVRRDQAFGWEKIGDVHMKKGDFDEALGCFLQSYELYETNWKEMPDKGTFARDLTVGLQKLGGIYEQQKKWDIAGQNFRRGLEVIGAVEKSSPDVFQPRDRSILLNRLGAVLLEQDDLAMALTSFSESKAIAEAILQSSPDSLQAQRDLSFSLSYLGKTAFRSEDWSQAEEYYLRSLTFREAIAESDRLNFASQIDLADALVQLAQVEIKRGLPAGLARMRSAITLIESLDSKAVEDSIEARKLLDEAKEAISESVSGAP